MRYRPLGARGQVVSSISLILEPHPSRQRPSDWVSFVYEALECGVSGFEIAGMDAALGAGLGQALSAIERRLVFVALRIGEGAGRRPQEVSLQAVGAEVRGALERTGLGYLDAVLLNEPVDVGVPALRELSALRSAGLVRGLGAAGEGKGVDTLIEAGALDVVATGFSLLSGWTERRRLRTAIAADMAVLGYGAYPAKQLESLMQPAARTRADPLAGVGGYGFLHTTREWTAEELCIAYALTETCLATVLVRAQSADDVSRLAAIADRELPPGAAAQIEMARFSALADAQSRGAA